MIADTEVARTVKAQLNFARDRSNGGVWSNAMPHLTTQTLQAEPVEIRDARSLPRASEIVREGFALIDDGLTKGDWSDEGWVLDTYLPRCLDAVRQVTGASRAIPVHRGILLRDTGDARAVPAAEFVHIDRDRATSERLVQRTLAGEADKTFRRAMILNVWRAISPPPQDVPLAVCDQRTVDDRDWVFGKTVEPTQPEGAPYVTSVFDAGQRWYYIPHMTHGEVLLFKNYDSEEGQPLGCLHGAFKLPGVAENAVPRASVEARILALYD